MSPTPILHGGKWAQSTQNGKICKICKIRIACCGQGISETCRNQSWVEKYLIAWESVPSLLYNSKVSKWQNQKMEYDEHIFKITTQWSAERSTGSKSDLPADFQSTFYATGNLMNDINGSEKWKT